MGKTGKLELMIAPRCTTDGVELAIGMGMASGHGTYVSFDLDGTLIKHDMMVDRQIGGRATGHAGLS